MRRLVAIGAGALVVVCAYVIAAVLIPRGGEPGPATPILETTQTIVPPNRDATRGGESQKFEFRVYDAAGKVPAELTTADIVRESAEGGPTGDGKAGVFFALTPTGESKFCRLTRALAH